jgi:hypothetical protein
MSIRLKNCVTADAISNYLKNDNQKVKIITKNGGRRFEFENGDNVSEKSIIKQMEKVKNLSCDHVITLLKDLKNLSNLANEQLAQEKGPLVKFLTFCKQFFGNLGYSKASHLEAMMKPVRVTLKDLELPVTPTIEADTEDSTNTMSSESEKDEPAQSKQTPEHLIARPELPAAPAAKTEPLLQSSSNLPQNDSTSAFKCKQSEFLLDVIVKIATDEIDLKSMPALKKLSANNTALLKDIEDSTTEKLWILIEDFLDPRGMTKQLIGPIHTYIESQKKLLSESLKNQREEALRQMGAGILNIINQHARERMPPKVLPLFSSGFLSTMNTFAKRIARLNENELARLYQLNKEFYLLLASITEGDTFVKYADVMLDNLLYMSVN